MSEQSQPVVLFCQVMCQLCVLVKKIWKMDTNWQYSHFSPNTTYQKSLGSQKRYFPYCYEFSWNCQTMTPDTTDQLLFYSLNRTYLKNIRACYNCGWYIKYLFFFKWFSFFKSFFIVLKPWHFHCNITLPVGFGPKLFWTKKLFK